MVTVAVYLCRTTSSSIWRALPTTASVRMQTSSSLYMTLVRPNRSGRWRYLSAHSPECSYNAYSNACKGGQTQTCVSSRLTGAYSDWQTLSQNWLLLQWKVYGETEQKWRTKEPREGWSSVCSLHGNFYSLLTLNATILHLNAYENALTYHISCISL